MIINANIAICVIRFDFKKFENGLLTCESNKAKNALPMKNASKCSSAWYEPFASLLVLVMGMVMRLDQIGLDSTPILAGAGILG